VTDLCGGFHSSVMCGSERTKTRTEWGAIIEVSCCVLMPEGRGFIVMIDDLLCCYG